jgi:type IV pilus assembly protein PilX
MSPSTHGAKQEGASLVVVLILLLVMTLLGLAVLRGVLLEERMSANLLDRSQNFQATEAALREAEGLIAANAWGVNPPAAGAACSNGMCGAPAAGTADRATDTAFAGWRNAAVNVSNAAGAQPSAPQFFVEHAGWSETWFECNLDPKYRGSDLCIRPVYKITARSEAVGRASVILQSSFIAP